jgi:uncharacterized membrane protein
VKPNRVRSLDVARGLVMVLMAVDHVRVFAAVPAGGPTAALFFTRWITHFCAPGFVFFAGASAWLHQGKLPSMPKLSRFLLLRGAWLVFLELTVMRFFWTFNFDVFNYNLAGVLWMIGWSMIALAGLSWLPFNLIVVLSLAIVFGHNLIDPYVRDLGRAVADDPLRWAYQFLYFGGSVRVGEAGPRIAILYSLLPWIGVMAAGYTFGAVLEMAAERRHRICLMLGAGCILLFVLLRTFNVYGDPRPWTPQQPLSFLNTTKYPASLQFLLMTLGPLILLLPVFDRARPSTSLGAAPSNVEGRGWIVNALELFGRVPLFYYVLHIPLIHLAAIVISLMRTGAVTPWLFGNHPLEPPEPPNGYRWSLTLLYLVTAICVGLLFVACRWYSGRKFLRGPATSIATSIATLQQRH